MSTEFEREHEILFSTPALKIGESLWYMLRAKTLLREVCINPDFKPGKIQESNEIYTPFGKEVLGHEIHWWVYQNENNHEELFQKTRIAYDSLRKLKADADLLKRTYTAESYQKLIVKLKEFAESQEKQIEVFSEYVKWLASVDPRAPILLFSFEGWGSTTRIHDRTLTISHSSIDDDPEMVKICMEFALGLRDHYFTTKHHVEMDIASDYYDSMDKEHPRKLHIDKKRLNTRITFRVFDEFVIFLENVRDSLRYLIDQIEKFNSEILPVVRTIKICERQKDTIRICLAQIDYSLKKVFDPFSYVPEKPDLLKEKILSIISIAKENSVDVLCFPELSFKKDWLDEIIKISGKMIVAGGTYYENGCNVCALIIDGKLIEPSYKKNQPAVFELGSSHGIGMKSGNNVFVFETSCGILSILTCIDYAKLSRHVITNSRKPVEIIINPCYDENIRRFQAQCNTDCENENLTIIQTNRSNIGSGKFGNSCVISKEHLSVIRDLEEEGYRDSDDEKYLLVKAKGEQLVIVDLNINEKFPPVDLPIGYKRRINVIMKFEFDGKWIEI